jgi:aminoglycoside phosphotransferase (APT) family kinase protein
MTQSDTDTLAAFLHRTIFPGALEVALTGLRRVSGGASWETFFVELRIRWGSSEETEHLVLKRAPLAGAMGPYEVTKDVVIFQTFEGSPIPTPRLMSSTEDPSVFGRPFTVSSFIVGDSPDLTKVEQWSTWQISREELGYAIIDVASELARFPWQETPLPSVMGPAGGCADRIDWMIDRYMDPLLARSELAGVPQTFCRDVSLWLRENVYEIPENELTVVHGDFRFGNFIFRDTELVGVVDWERAMLGDPMSNLGFFCMPMSRWETPELMGRAITFGQLKHRYETVNGLELVQERLHYYMIFWQFLESVNVARNSTEVLLGTNRLAGSRPLVTMNLLVRQTLELIQKFDSGQHEIP